MRSYPDDQLDQYKADRLEWLRRSDALADRVLSREFANDLAEQFAREGFVRRLKNLDHAMFRMDEIYPPNFDNASRERMRDAELLLQAFVMNVFGAIDNLAWIWSVERGVKRRNGQDLSIKERVFGGPGAKHLLASLTPAIRTIINEASEWFKEIGAYRHGVAHQIPIYIPRMLSKEDVEESRRLGLAIDKAMVVEDHEAFGELLDQRNSLGDYGPFMALSGSRAPMKLHPQMVCDLATVVNLGEAVIADLDVLV